MLTEAEIKDWKKDETTKKVLELITDRIDENVAYIGRGNVIGETIDETVQETCRIAGMIAGLSYIFELEGEVVDE